MNSWSIIKNWIAIIKIIVIKPLGLLGLTAASSAVDVQVLEDSKILLKGV